MLPLIEVLRTPCVATKVWAAHALGRMGPAAEAAAPALRRLCRAESPAVRRAARDALRRVNAPAPATSPDGRWGRLLTALRGALGAVHA